MLHSIISVYYIKGSSLHHFEIYFMSYGLDFFYVLYFYEVCVLTMSLSQQNTVTLQSEETITAWDLHREAITSLLAVFIYEYDWYTVIYICVINALSIYCFLSVSSLYDMIVFIFFIEVYFANVSHFMLWFFTVFIVVDLLKVDRHFTIYIYHRFEKYKTVLIGSNETTRDECHERMALRMIW